MLLVWGTTLRVAQKQNLKAMIYSSVASLLLTYLNPASSQMGYFPEFWCLVWQKNFKLRWDSYKRKLTILKCIIQWHLAYSQCYTHQHLLELKSFLSPPQEDHYSIDKVSFKAQNTSSATYQMLKTQFSTRHPWTLTILTFSEWAQHQKR